MREPARILSFFLAIGMVLLHGCASIGPSTISKDRLGYTLAIAQSIEEQILINVVKARYVEAPSFVDVSQLVASYELEEEVQVSTEIHPRSSIDTFLGPGITGRLVDRPTMTYAPLTGERFARAVMGPIPLHLVLSLLQSGWSADAMIKLFVSSINGIHNRLPRVEASLPADPEFDRLALLLRRLQDAGALDFRIQSKEEHGHAVFLVVHAPRQPEVEADLSTLRSLLNVKPEETEIQVRFGLLPGAPGEITLATFSLAQVLLAQGEHLHLPAQDLEQGYALQVNQAGVRTSAPHMSIMSSKDRPEYAFAPVRYRNNWFWIDARDSRSKATLAAIAIVYRLLESGEPGAAPVLTIPTG